jgi:hypothetical protein
MVCTFQGCEEQAMTEEKQKAFQGQVEITVAPVPTREDVQLYWMHIQEVWQKFACPVSLRVDYAGTKRELVAAMKKLLGQSARKPDEFLEYSDELESWIMTQKVPVKDNDLEDFQIRSRLFDLAEDLRVKVRLIDIDIHYKTSTIRMRVGRATPVDETEADRSTG